METKMTNTDISRLFRNVAAAYQILNENRFKIIAYDRAADSIQQLTKEVRDLWAEGNLADVPGIGAGITAALTELFQTGKVKHFTELFKKVPHAVFPLLLVPGLGPKKAFKLVSVLKIREDDNPIEKLEKAAKKHAIAHIEGFGEKSEQDILESLRVFRKGQIKENRIELPTADSLAQEIITYIQDLPKSYIVAIDVLGSLRRKMPTIGDIDIAVATHQPDSVIEHFVTFPHQKIIEKGPTGASLLLHNGRQVDVRVQEPKTYGSMLQYFTGSKNHNIKLRSYALGKGMSLNEYGIKDIKDGKVRSFKTEEAFYTALRLPWIPPEIREDKGEIEAGIRQIQGIEPGLPKLVETTDIKGDLHIHTSYDLETSHDLGVSSIREYLDDALKRGYSYIGISDHNPSVSDHTEKQIVDIMKRRKEFYEQQYSSWVQKLSGTNVSIDRAVHMFIMCEVDIQPDGKLALPIDAFSYVDAVIVSVHSSFLQTRQQMTKRVLAALGTHPKIRIFGHPTGRLLNKREGIDLLWKEIFAVCKSRNITLEINAHPARLDLPDSLVYEAKRDGIRFCINTDSHGVDQMDVLPYGVSVARRGWAEKHDIVNTMEYNKFTEWLL